MYKNNSKHVSLSINSIAIFTLQLFSFSDSKVTCVLTKSLFGIILTLWHLVELPVCHVWGGDCDLYHNVIEKDEGPRGDVDSKGGRASENLSLYNTRGGR